MFKKIMQTLANVGTVALLGYEIGSQQQAAVEKDTDKSVSEKPKVIISSDNHSEIIIFGIVIVVIILVAMFVYLMKKKRPLV